MTDEIFIAEMVEKTKLAGRIVDEQFYGLNVDQVNWKPAPEQWSIGQCLDHLVVSDSLYFSSFEKIAGGRYVMGKWEKWNPFSGLFGKMLVSQLAEHTTKKVKSPKLFTPDHRQIDTGVFQRFQKHLDTMTALFNGCKKADIDQLQITSPVSKMITYNVRHAITILVNHEHRHINQAINIKNHLSFPNVAS